MSEQNAGTKSQNSSAHAKNTEIEIGKEDCLIMLSTCNYSFKNARCVLMGKLIDREPIGGE